MRWCCDEALQQLCRAGNEGAGQDRVAGGDRAGRGMATATDQIAWTENAMEAAVRFFARRPVESAFPVGDDEAGMRAIDDDTLMLVAGEGCGGETGRAEASLKDQRLGPRIDEIDVKPNEAVFRVTEGRKLVPQRNLASPSIRVEGEGEDQPREGRFLNEKMLHNAFAANMAGKIPAHYRAGSQGWATL